MSTSNRIHMPLSKAEADAAVREHQEALKTMAQSQRRLAVVGLLVLLMCGLTVYLLHNVSVWGGVAILVGTGAFMVILRTMEVTRNLRDAPRVPNGFELLEVEEGHVRRLLALTRESSEIASKVKSWLEAGYELRLRDLWYCNALAHDLGMERMRSEMMGQGRADDQVVTGTAGAHTASEPVTAAT